MSSDDLNSIGRSADSQSFDGQAMVSPTGRATCAGENTPARWQRTGREHVCEREYLQAWVRGCMRTYGLSGGVIWLIRSRKSSTRWL